MIPNKKGFTLVELIVTVTILAVLATIWFVSYAGYAAQARDSNRLAAVAMIEKAIEIDSMKSGEAVMPDDVVEIRIWSTVVWYQGDAGKSVFSKILFNGSGTDPKYWDYYTYFLSADKTKSQILTYLETATYANESIVGLSSAYAQYNFETRFPYYKWAGLWILIDENNLPVNRFADAQSTGIYDMFTVDNAAKEVVALFNNQQNFQNKSLFVGWQLESRSRKYKKLNPKQCPQNYILVPGNLDLWQTDFCVGKYEASQNGSSKNNSFLTVAGNLPVNWIVVNWNTIELCEWNGKWYHTMTFNEWRTIARNIEQQPENWSGGNVWSGHIFGWNNGSTLTGYNAGSILASWPSGNQSEDQLRQLTLSNGEVIWDFIWNVREVTQHMNLTNMNGSNLNPFYTYDHNTYQTVYENISIDWLSSWDKIGWWTINDLNYQNNYGPKTTYDISSWMGMLFYPGSSTDIRYFLTGWDYSTSIEYENGLYSILHHNSSSNSNIWIRCAYIPN